MGSSPFSLIDQDILAQFRAAEDLTAIIPAARITMSAKTVEALQPESRSTPAPFIRIVPGSMSFSTERGSDRLMIVSMPYEIRLYQGSHDLGLLRDISYQAWRVVSAPMANRQMDGSPLTPRLPLQWVHNPIRAVSVPPPAPEEDEGWRGVLRLDCLFHSQLAEFFPIPAPVLFEASYFTGPNRVLLTYYDGVDTEITIKAFSISAESGGFPFSYKDSGGSPITIPLTADRGRRSPEVSRNAFYSNNAIVCHDSRS